MYYCISTVVQFRRRDTVNWTLDKSRPICPQIEEILCVMIATGELKGGEKLFSVREVALKASVNPNTVQKAFESLEAKQLLTSVRGSGWYVSEDASRAGEMVDELKRIKTQEYVDGMIHLGVKRETIQEYISEYIKESNK